MSKLDGILAQSYSCVFFVSLKPDVKIEEQSY